MMNETSIDQQPFPRTRWALVWIVGFFALQIMFGTIAVLLAFPEIDDAAALMAVLRDVPRSGPANLYGAAAAGLAIVLGLTFYLRRGGRVASIGLDNWGRLGLAKAFGAGLLILLTAAALTQLYARYVVPGSPLQGQTRQMIAAMSDGLADQIVLYLVIVVFAAIIEEVLFRGLLQNGLKRRVGPYWAIVIAGLVFAAVHMQLLAFPILALMGMAFGLLYHFTGSLRVTILLHMINNAAALLLS